MSDADVADMAAGPSGLDGLQHRFLGADRLDDRVCPRPLVSSLMRFTPASPRSAMMSVAPNSRARRWRVSWRLIATIRSAPELTGGQYRAQSDRSVTDHYHGLAGPGFGGDGPEPARTQHVGGRQEIRHEISRGNLRSGDQSAVGQRDPHPLSLCAACGAEDLAVDARRRIAGAADLTGVVGGEEPAHHELAGPDRGDLSAPTSSTMPTYSWPIGIGPSTGSAPRYGHRSDPQMHDADKLNDRVGRTLDSGFGPLLDSYVTGGVHHRRAHYRSPPQGCRAVSPRTHHPGNAFPAFPGTACRDVYR